MEANQHLVIFGHGLVDVPEHQDIGRAVFRLDDRLRGVSPGDAEGVPYPIASAVSIWAGPTRRTPAPVSPSSTAPSP